MNLSGILNSVASVHAATAKCPRCNGSAQIDQGECLSCLLQAGLEEGGETEGESLDLLLAEVDVRDSDWRLGNYQILDEIGRGGMGVIYRARQRHSKRIVAVKRILGYHGDSPETLERFRREAEAAASLDHPNILPIHEVGEADGLPFFTMKFATGGSLQNVAPALRNEPRECARILAKVARAVAAAHRARILHRDLKPGNVLLDSHGEPMVSDFGLAKWIDATSDLTRSLAIFGTPGFIAPEQARGDRSLLSPAADVYSLGAILFDLLAGRPPFLGEHALAVIRQAEEKPAPKLRSLVANVDRDLETICAKCLEREPQMRYHSATDLAEDLERWLEGRPIIARPVSPPAQAWRWARRNPVLAGMAAACLLLGGVLVLRQLQSRELNATVQREVAAAHSIAVLPFLNLDTVVPDKAFGVAIAHELSAKMSDIGPSRVTVAKNSAKDRFITGSAGDAKEIGRESRVRAILSGSVRTTPTGLRVAVRFLNAANAEVLAVQIFDLEKSEHAAREVADKITHAFYTDLDRSDLAEITPANADPGLQNPATRGLIMSGRDLHYRYNLTDFDRSISCYEKALKLEPNSALAHAYLAGALGGRSRLAQDAASLTRAEAEAREAVRLAATSGETRRTLAGIMYLKGDIPAAARESLNTIEASGPDGESAGLLAASYSTLGRPELGLSWYLVARHSEARPGEYDSFIADCWTALEEDEKATEFYRLAADLRPDRPQGPVGLCRLHLLRREFPAALECVQQNLTPYKTHLYAEQLAAQTAFFRRDFPTAEKLYRALWTDDPEGGGGFYGAITYETALARVAIQRGDREAASALLEKAAAREKSGGAADSDHVYRLAAIAALRGEDDEAFQQLQNAIDAGWLDRRSLELDPRFDSIAGKPAFGNLCSEIANKISNARAVYFARTATR